MKVIELDARRMQEKESAHTYLMEQLSFPEYYGKNMDALFDCLGELGQTQIVLRHMVEAEEYFWKLYRVFKDAADENTDLVIREL